jgi:H+/Cl- antiporter ClcA
MKGRVKQMLGFIIGGIIGGVSGYLYYRLVGCPSGSCPITSNPYISTIYGIAMGLLIAGILK